MDTPNLITVVNKGPVIAQYTLWDGHPKGQGVRILKFLQNPANIERLKMGLQHTYTLSHEEYQYIYNANRLAIKFLWHCLQQIYRPGHEEVYKLLVARLRKGPLYIYKPSHEIEKIEEEIGECIHMLRKEELHQTEGRFKKCLTQIDEEIGGFINTLCKDFDQIGKIGGLITERLERFRNRIQHVMQNHEELGQLMEKANRLIIKYRKDYTLNHKDDIDICVFELVFELINEYGLESRVYSELTLWPSLSHNTGDGILELVAQATEDKRVPIQLDPKFEHCFWAYVVNLDHNVFEVYEGFKAAQSMVDATGKRFNGIGDEKARVPACVKSFNNLPTKDEFIAAFDPFYWDIKRVLQQFQNFPPQSFVKALDDHQIDGTVLLWGVTPEALEKEFHIKDARQRCGIWNKILELRRMSDGYAKWIAEWGKDHSLVAAKIPRKSPSTSKAQIDL